MKARLPTVEEALRAALLGWAFTLPISITLAQTLFFGAAVPLAVAAAWKRKIAFRPRACPLFGPVLLFSAVAVAASAWGVRPLHSLMKCHRLLMLAIPFLLGGAFEASLAEARAGASRAEHALAAFGAGVAGLGLYDLVRFPLRMWQGERLYDLGNMRDPQFYMVALCFALARGLRTEQRRERRWASALGVLCVLGVLAHCKRGVWAATLCAVSLVGAVARRYRLLLVAVSAALVLLAVPEARTRLVQARAEWSPRAGGRYVLWTRVAPALLRKYPWGMGLCGVRHEDLARHARYVQPGLNHLHNNFLQVALELGWAGLAAWIYWMGITAASLAVAYRRARQEAPEHAWMALGGLGGFAGLMINGLVEYNFGDSEILMLLGLIMGVSCWLAKRERPEKGAAT